MPFAPMRLLRAPFLALTLVIPGSAPALAHDPTAVPIRELTRRIQAHPDSLSLLLERGEYRRLMGDHAGAAADFAEVERRDPTHPGLDLCRAALAIDRGDLAAARALLDGALAERPGDPAVLLLRVRAREALGDRRGAVADLGALVERLERPSPDLYLRRARLLVAEGDQAAALAGLDEAIARIGRLASLERYAIELELAAGRPAEADARLNALGATYPDLAPLEDVSARVAAAAGRTRLSVPVDRPAPVVSVPASVVGPVPAPSRVVDLAAAAAAVTAIPRGATWKYLATPTAADPAWNSVGFVDTSWPAGPGALGFGESYIVTTVPYGPDAGNRYRTTYFRTEFTAGSPSAILYLTMTAAYDDGFVAYINGVEVARRGIPEGPVSYGTLATSHEGGVYEFIDLSAAIGGLVVGTNLFAVEVHQTSPSSSDLVWDMDLEYTDVAVVTRGPYLQAGTPDAITVRWRTDAATNSRVRYGLSLGSLTGEVSDGTLTTEHEIRLTGLLPSTRYYYSVGTSAVPLAGDASHRFGTAPPVGASAPTRIWVVGDSGLPGASANAVRDAYAAWTGARGTDLWLMLGDNAYNTGTDLEYQSGFFDLYPVMLKQSVVWPTRGNHDFIFAGANNDYYDFVTLPTAGEAGGLASGSEAYYSFDWGDIHFICLDSEGTDRSPGGAMLTWLANDLAANARRWVIAFWHHPPYTKGSHDSDNDADSGGRMRDMRANALPILEAAGVDLVLTGHSHSYERSFLLDGHYGVSTTLTPAMKLDAGDGRVDGDGPYLKPGGEPPAHAGEVSVVAGSAAQISGGTLNHPAMVTSFNLLGSMVLDVEGNRLDARFLNQTGVALDSFTIIKGSSVAAPVRHASGGGLRLGPGMPNPFTLQTHLSYALEHAGRVRLTLHDASGRRVVTLADGWREAGIHDAHWDGRDAGGRPLPTGVYLAVLEAAGSRVSRKIAHVR